MNKMPLFALLMLAGPALAGETVFEKNGTLSGPVCPNGYAGKVSVTVSDTGKVTATLDGGNWCLSDTILARGEVRLYATDGRELAHLDLATDVPGRGLPFHGEVRRGDSRTLTLPSGVTIGSVDISMRNDGGGSPIIEIFKGAVTIVDTVAGK